MLGYIETIYPNFSWQKLIFKTIYLCFATIVFFNNFMSHIDFHKTVTGLYQYINTKMKSQDIIGRHL